MPPAASAAARRSTHAAPRRASGSAVPRRVSGPAPGRRAVPRGTAVARAGTLSGPRPLALRVTGAVAGVAGAVHGVAEHRLLDRIIRGRVWIAILGIGLIGIVFMQVSMLRMNAGIGTAVERATTLERQNQALATRVSQLSSGERIQGFATRMGMTQPTTTAAYFVDASKLNLRKAVAGITPPSTTPPAAATPPLAAATSLTPASTVPPVTSATPADTAPVTPTAQTAQAPAAATSAATTSATATSAATTAPVTTAPATAADPSTPVSTPTASSSGGGAAAPGGVVGG